MDFSSLKPFILVVDRELAYLDAARDYFRKEFFEYPILFDPGPIDAIHTALHTLTGPAIFVIAYDLGDMTGGTVINVLKKRFRYPSFFLLLTPKDNHELAVQALDKDVQPFSKEPPPGGPEYNLGSLFKAQIKFAERTLKRENTDLLTGAYNRGQALEIWKKDFVQVKKRHQFASFFFLDVNFLHEMNVTYGDQAGDDLIQSVGQCLIRSVGASESIVCRQGGDEFLVILLQTDRSKAMRYGSMIRSMIDDLRIKVKPGKFATVSVSMGFTVLAPDEMPSDAHEALKLGARRASRNMRKNKRKMHAMLGDDHIRIINSKERV